MFGKVACEFRAAFLSINKGLSIIYFVNAPGHNLPDYFLWDSNGFGYCYNLDLFYRYLYFRDCKEGRQKDHGA